MASYDYEVAHANIAAKVMKDDNRRDERHTKTAAEKRLKNGLRKYQKSKKALKKEAEEEERREQQDPIETPKNEPKEHETPNNDERK